MLRPMFDLGETLTHEEILVRFKKLFDRDMTADEKRMFFFPDDATPLQTPERGSALA